MMIMGFAGFTTFGIPLIIPAAPPVEEKLTGDITMEQYVAIGDKIFHGKGTCTLCHKAVGGRAPDLAAVGSRAEERVKEAEYKGKATTGEEYIHESMIEPSAYVVAGFGKPGTNDTVSPMPNISKGAIGLSDLEIGAVIAFLQTWAGADVTVALPTGEAPAAEEAPAEIKLAATPEEAFNKFECTMCHMLPGVEEGGDMGPDLTKVAELAGTRKKGMSADAYLYESITDPNAFIVPEFDSELMPDDFSERMVVGELKMIIDALMGREQAKSAGGEE